ncbi:MAG: hypothetical protein HY692_05685 [Cyanobacteria bacterium NC_groundwater_1444_Ag_S-0.65um_54_12]|nr:hypothetical protein [Cyanobacteria bacterium NC_groundwater_1444_Ag_S-0.65um_54_12]
MPKRLIAALFMIGSWPVPAVAGATDARALSLGNAYSALADEADMAAWNPALLGLSRSKAKILLFTAPSLHLGVGNNFLSYDSILNLLPDAHGNPRSLSEANVKVLLSGLTEGSWQLALDGGLRAALAIPLLRTSIHFQADADVQGIGLPRGLLELLLSGNTSVKQLPLETLAGGKITSLASVGISHAIPIPLPFGRQSAVGVTVRYLQGLAYATIPEASGSLLSSDADGKISSNAYVRYLATWPGATRNTFDLGQLLQLGQVGSGVAADLGFTNQWNEHITWGITVGNLGYLRWHKVKDRIFTTYIEPFGGGFGLNGPAKLPDFNQAKKEINGPQDGKSNIDGGYPPFGRLGFAWSGALGFPPISKEPGFWNTPAMPITLTADLQQGFGTGYGISLNPELRLGMEARPLGAFLPLRIGTTLGGNRPLAAVGIGLDISAFRLDIASGTMFGILGNAKGSYFTLTSSLLF